MFIVFGSQSKPVMSNKPPRTVLPNHQKQKKNTFLKALVSCFTSVFAFVLERAEPNRKAFLYFAWTEKLRFSFSRFPSISLFLFLPLSLSLSGKRSHCSVRMQGCMCACVVVCVQCKKMWRHTLRTKASHKAVLLVFFKFCYCCLIIIVRFFLFIFSGQDFFKMLGTWIVLFTFISFSLSFSL